MILTRPVPTVTHETADVLCNRCGLSCRHAPGENFGGLLEVQCHGNMDARVLPDGTKFTFSMCESCLGRLFCEFTHAPKATTGLIGRKPLGWKDGMPVWPPQDVDSDGYARAPGPIPGVAESLKPITVECNACYGEGRVAARCCSCDKPLTQADLDRDAESEACIACQKEDEDD